MRERTVQPPSCLPPAADEGSRHLMRACACLVVLVGLVLGSHDDGSTQPGRVPRIGYLATHPAWTPYFHSAMKNQGYVEGTNLRVEWRVSDLEPGHLRTFAQELVALGVDLIFVDSTPAALAVKSATERLPIVFAALVDPVWHGPGRRIAETWRQPDRNDAHDPGCNGQAGAATQGGCPGRVDSSDLVEPHAPARTRSG